MDNIPTGRRDKHKIKKRKTKREEIYHKAGDNQMFAKVIKNNGPNFSVMCSDVVERIGRPSNAMRRGTRLKQDDIVLISLREFGDNKFCDILGLGDPYGETKNKLVETTCKFKTYSNVDVVFETDEIEIFDEDTGETISWDNLLS